MTCARRLAAQAAKRRTAAWHASTSTLQMAHGHSSPSRPKGPPATAGQLGIRAPAMGSHEYSHPAAAKVLVYILVSRRASLICVTSVVPCVWTDTAVVLATHTASATLHVPTDVLDLTLSMPDTRLLWLVVGGYRPLRLRPRVLRSHDGLRAPSHRPTADDHAQWPMRGVHASL